MLKVSLVLGTGRMTSLSAGADAASRYRQNDMEAETSHPDLDKLTEAERKLREAREASNERIDQETLDALNKPKPKPDPKKKDAEGEGEDEEEPDADTDAKDDAASDEEGDEDFE